MSTNTVSNLPPQFPVPPNLVTPVQLGMPEQEFWLLLVMSLLIVLVSSIYWRGRVVEERACPKCAHSAHGLREARCPECGTSFDSGVMRRGSLRSAPRIGFGVTLACLGLVLSFFVFVILQRSWPGILHRWSDEQNTAHWEYQSTLAGSEEQHRPETPTRLRVIADAVFVGDTTISAPADIEVDLLNDDVVVASWKGTGQWNAYRSKNPNYSRLQASRPDKARLEFDEALVVASLREQVLAQTDSPFAYLFDDEELTTIFTEEVVLHASPIGGLAGRYQKWWDAQDQVVLVIEGEGSGSITRAVVWPNDIWWAPIYVIPIVILLGCLVETIRVLRVRRSLVPFEPEPAAVSDVPSQAESEAELVT